jgi:hypothetical protein
MKLYISLMFGVGIGAWVFNKMVIRTHRAQAGVVTALAVGLIAFLVFYTFLATFIKFK